MTRNEPTTQAVAFDELYQTLDKLRPQIFKYFYPLKSDLKWKRKASVDKMLFQALAKMYLLGMAVGIRGEKKRAPHRMKTK